MGNGLCSVVLRHSIVLDTIHHTFETKYPYVSCCVICFGKTYHVHVYNILCVTHLHLFSDGATGLEQ